MQFNFLYKKPFLDSTPYLWCDAHPASVPRHPQVQSPSATIRERVTSRHNPEVFPGRSVMPVVGFLPPRSWDHLEVSLSPLSPSPLPFSLVLSASGRAAQRPAQAHKGLVFAGQCLPGAAALGHAGCPQG